MATALHHFAITVSEMDRSVEFYTRYFDLRQILRTDLSGEGISSAMAIPETDIEAVLLACENTVFELIQFRNPRGAEHRGNYADVGTSHPCFVVRDLDELHARMSADGVRFNAPPQELGWGTKMAYCLDPDGLMIEVLQPGPELELDHLLAQGA